jgi:Domain of unknown function (DUF5047)
MYAFRTAEANQAVNGTHAMVARALVTSPGIRQLTLPISDGSVTCDATSQTRRTATLVADPEYWPSNPLDVLAPFGTYADIQYGIPLLNGTIDWMSLGIFYLDANQRQRPIQSNAGLQVTLSDRSSRIAEDRATAPIQTINGATCVAEIIRIIQLTDPTIVVTDLTGSTQVAPQIVISQDKWADGVEALANAIGAEVATDRQNGFFIRNQPTINDTAVWTVQTGEFGNLIQVTEVLDRVGVYNQFVISGTRADGTVQVSAIVQDTDTASPTYIFGPFGKRTRYYTSALLTTVPQCITTGQAFLNRVKGFCINPSMTSLVHPGLEAGDVLKYVDGGSPMQVLMDTVVTPLNNTTAQTLTLRANTLPDEG